MKKYIYGFLMTSLMGAGLQVSAMILEPTREDMSAYLQVNAIAESHACDYNEAAHYIDFKAWGHAVVYLPPDSTEYVNYLIDLRPGDVKPIINLIKRSGLVVGRVLPHFINFDFKSGQTDDEKLLSIYLLKMGLAEINGELYIQSSVDCPSLGISNFNIPESDPSVGGN